MVESRIQSVATAVLQQLIKLVAAGSGYTVNGALHRAEECGESCFALHSIYNNQVNGHAHLGHQTALSSCLGLAYITQQRL